MPPKSKEKTSEEKDQRIRSFLDVGEKILLGLVLPLIIFGAKMYADAQVTKEKLQIVNVRQVEAESKLEKKFESVFIRLERQVKEIAGEVNKDAQSLIILKERLRSLSQNLDEIKEILRGRRKKERREQ